MALDERPTPAAPPLATISRRAAVAASGLAGLRLGEAFAGPRRRASQSGRQAQEVDRWNIVKLEEIELYVPCANGGAGETVIVEGPIHVAYLFRWSASGRGLMTFHAQPQGVRGAGQVSGAVYHAVGVTRYTLTVYPGQTYTWINRYRFVGEGSAGTYSLRQTTHLTVNANLEASVAFDRVEEDCR